MTDKLWGTGLLAGHLIDSLRTVFGQDLDSRNGANKQYGFDDLAMSAFRKIYADIQIIFPKGRCARASFCASCRWVQKARFQRS